MSISASLPQAPRSVASNRAGIQPCERQSQPLNAARGIMVAAGLSTVFWVSLLAFFL